MAAMEIETGDDILRKVAADGSMDYSSWPALLPAIVSRIEKIAHHDFPIPHIPPPPPPPPARPTSPRFLTQLPSSDLAEGADSSDTAISSQENKENTSPPSSLPFGQPTTASAPSSSSSTIHHRSSSSSPPPSSSAALPSHQDLPRLQQNPQQPQEPALPPGTLPTPVAALLSEVTSTLALNFITYPPHTIQRLAELLLRPRQHYRSLVAYLHALDRVVHVTSGANIYPLPPAIPDMSAMSLLANGIAGAGLGAGGGGSGVSLGTAAGISIGSDEALGGALLTPIPWLAQQANGAGIGGGGGSSEDGSSDAGSTSPMSSGSSSGSGSVSVPAPSPQQQQRQSATALGPSASGAVGAGGRKLEAQLRTESTETIEGPNGMGSIETVSISVNGIPSMGAAGASGLGQRGVTQGELLRQEQRAGVVPVSQLARRGQGPQQQQELERTAGDEDAPMTENGGPSEAGVGEEEEEVPHARGPEEIGAADMGPQPTGSNPFTRAANGSVDMQGFDAEGAVGRRLPSPPVQQAETAGLPTYSVADKTAPSPKREAIGELHAGASKRLREDAGQESSLEKKDAEGDVVIPDDDEAVKTTEADSSMQQPSDTETGTTDGDPIKSRTDKEKDDVTATTEAIDATTAAATAKQDGGKEDDGEATKGD